MTKFFLVLVGAIALTIFGLAAFLPLVPIEAAKQPKFDVCHFGEAEVDDPGGWRIININGNALKAHVGKHGDGVFTDAVVDDTLATPDSITSADCLAR